VHWRAYSFRGPTVEAGKDRSGKVTLVDSARNCALAVQRLLGEEGVKAPPGSTGGLQVGLTDRPDNFLRVAKEALHLEIGDIELREVVHAPA